ncbi:GL26170 [Drosophila persimilis]|uniref:GL26170 n=1 Tax=Drosophila persimilis TaxID=7234 RepID=B4GKV4_DROPE|nr:GL26170 [Drosophila persimilis]
MISSEGPAAPEATTSGYHSGGTYPSTQPYPGYYYQMPPPPPLPAETESTAAFTSSRY